METCTTTKSGSTTASSSTIEVTITTGRKERQDRGHDCGQRKPS